MIVHDEIGFELSLTPNQKLFCLSDAEIVALMGPMGEGKTFAGGARALVKSAGRDRQLRGCLIRDNGTNIEDHTIPSLQKAFHQISTFKKVRQGTWRWRSPNHECIMFGLDSLTDLGKTLGAEWDYLWLEEPAPVVNTETAGLREEVFQMGYARLGRDLGRSSWIQLTMNAADEHHWTTKYLVDSPFPGTEVFHIQHGENPYIPDSYRDRVKLAFRDRPDLYRRYVKGLTGSVQSGEAVTPAYREDTHRSKAPLNPLPIDSAMQLWDGWHNPTCLIAQRTPRGKLLILDSVQGVNIGVKQLIQTQFKPLLSERYSHIRNWRVIGDETMRTADQSNTETTAAGVIERELGVDFEPCTNDWKPRRESLRLLLNAMLDGEQQFQVSSHERILHMSLRGGWHYPKSSSGVVGDKPVKDIHSHAGDALSYGAVKLIPWVEEKIPLIPNMIKRACSYAVGGRR